MNRPDKLNALSVELADALNDTWAHFEADPGPKDAILSAAGRAFCAGADIGGGGPNDDLRIPWAIRVHRAYPQNGVTVFKPIIGAVHGYALGGGSEGTA
jgi:enoyl-CoA hydratase/carnithine racemase